MELTGTYLLPCTPETAWEALNDPEVLKASLKGCEKLEKTSDTAFSGVISTRIGPVSARFNGTMNQTEVNAPNSCVMTFEGQGGIAGHAKGSATVTLVEENGGTRLSYVADTKIGGKLAQMGARLVEGAAKTVADDFFAQFSAALGADIKPAQHDETGPGAMSGSAEPAGKNNWLFVALGVLVLGGLVYYFAV